MNKKPPLTRNPATVEFERAQADAAAVVKDLGRAMKWESPIRAERRRKELARIESIVTECNAFDKLPAYASRVKIDWPYVTRSGMKLRPIRPASGRK